MKECANIEFNRMRCSCTYEPCSKKGICCECLSYHWRMNQLPACLFSKTAEQSFDRSIKNFIRDQGVQPG